MAGKAERPEKTFFCEQTTRISRKERFDLMSINRIGGFDFGPFFLHPPIVAIPPFSYFCGLSLSLSLLFFCAALLTASTTNHGRSSRSRCRPRGNVNTCLATADLSERIKNTISGRASWEARKARAGGLIESRRNHGPRFSRRTAFRSDGCSALKAKKEHRRSMLGFTTPIPSFNIPSD